MNNRVQDVFDKAIQLMDEQNEATGSTDTTDTKPYRVKAVGICNTLLGFVYPASDTYKVSAEGKRPICAAAETMESELDLDDFICASVLPWGMAAQFVLDDDKEKANFFWQTFLEQIEAAKRGIPAPIGEVEDVYGGIEHGEYGAWL